MPQQVNNIEGVNPELDNEQDPQDLQNTGLTKSITPIPGSMTGYVEPETEDVNARYRSRQAVKSLRDQWENPETMAYDPFYDAKRWAYDASHHGSNFERYAEVPRLFETIGFSPWRDNEALYKEQITWWEDWKRAASQSASIGWTSFKSMLPWNAWDPKYSDVQMAEEFERANAIGYSSLDGFGGFFNNLTLQSGFTLGMLAEFAAEEIVLWGATAALTYAGGPAGGTIGTGAAGTRTMTHVGTFIPRFWKGLKTLGKVAKSFKTVTNSLDKLKDANRVREIFRNVKLGKGMKQFLTPHTAGFVSDLTKDIKAGKAINSMATTARGAGSLYRDIREISAALAESKLEAGMVEQEMFNELYRGWKNMQDEDGNYINANTIPTNEQFEKWKELAYNAGAEVFWLNLPILYLSNKVVFDRAFKGVMPIREFKEQFAKQITKTVRFDKAAITAGEDAWKIVDKSLKARAKRISTYWKEPKNLLKDVVKNMTGYSKANWTEGAQEIYQDAASMAIKDYYFSRLEDKTLTSIHEPWKEFGGQAKQFMSSMAHMLSSKEGLEIFASGFLMGGLVQVPQKIVYEVAPRTFWKVVDRKGYNEYKAEKEEQLEKMVAAMNEVTKDFERFNNADYKNLVSQYINTRNYVYSGREEDAKAMMDSEDEATFEHISTLIRTGKLGMVLEALGDMKGLTSEELEQAYGKVEEGDAKSYYSSQIDGFTDKAKALEKRWKAIDELFTNPYRPAAYSRMKDRERYNQERKNYDAFEDAKKMAVFAGYSFDRAQARMQKIMETAVHKNPLLKNASANDFQILFDPTMLRTHEGLLAQEIKNMEGDTGGKGLPVADARELRLKKNKHEALKEYRRSLKTYRDRLQANKTRTLKTGEVSEEVDKNYEEMIKEDIGNLREAYVNYTRTIAEEAGEDMNMYDLHHFRFGTKLDESFTLLLDFYELDSDSSHYSTVMGLLTNPAYFNNVQERIRKVLDDAGNQKSEIFIKSYKDVQGMQEMNALINEMIRMGVYFDPDSLQDFKEKGIMPDYFLDITTHEPIYPGTTRFRKIEDLLDKFEAVNDIEFTERPVSGMKEALWEDRGRRKFKNDKRSYQDLASQFGFKADKPESEVLASEVLDAIINSRWASSREKALARRLKSIVGEKQTIKFKRGHGNPGSYSAETGVVIDARYSSENYKLPQLEAADEDTYGQPALEYVILHNQMHYLLDESLESDNEFNKKITDLRQAVQNYVIANNMKGVYGLETNRDFIAEVMTNDNFQQLLSRVEYETTGTTTWKEFLKTIIDRIKKALGLTAKDMDHNNVLNEALFIITNKIDKGRTLPTAGEEKTPKPPTDTAEEEEEVTPSPAPPKTEAEKAEEDAKLKALGYTTADIAEMGATEVANKIKKGTRKEGTEETTEKPKRRTIPEIDVVEIGKAFDGIVRSDKSQQDKTRELSQMQKDIVNKLVKSDVEPEVEEQIDRLYDRARKAIKYGFEYADLKKGSSVIVEGKVALITDKTPGHIKVEFEDGSAPSVKIPRPKIYDFIEGINNPEAPPIVSDVEATGEETEISDESVKESGGVVTDSETSKDSYEKGKDSTDDDIVDLFSEEDPCVPGGD